MKLPFPHRRTSPGRPRDRSAGFSRPARPFPPRIAILLALLASPHASAQSLPGFDSPGDTRAPAGPEDSAGAPGAAEHLVTLSSRELAGQLDAYLEIMRARLEIHDTTLDPFARHQDPDYRPPEPETDEESEPGRPSAPVTPFRDVVAGIPVTGVLPGKGFMVQDRFFQVGERIQLDINKPRPLPIHVVAVAGDRITFRNGQTNEEADLKIGIMPDGLRRGDGIELPGMRPANAPLQVNPVNGISSSR